MIRIETEIPGWFCNIVECEEDLPEIPEECEYFFMDHESTMFDPARIATSHRKNGDKGLFPYAGDRIAGTAVVYGKSHEGYYIPVRHKVKGKRSPKNISIEAFQNWLKKHSKIPNWGNANPKFDAHFSNVDGFDYKGNLVDCLVDAKIYNVEYPNHRLKVLCKNWVGLPMGDEVVIKTFLKGVKTGDYGEIPIDMCAQYAVLDCFGARQLLRWLHKNKRENSDMVLDIEHELTGVLYEMEKIGLRAEKKDLQLELRKCIINMIESATIITDLTDKEWVDSSKHIHDILCTQLNLPVLAWTKKTDKNTGKKIKGGPSFDKDALLLYLDHPRVKVNPVTKEVVENILKFRTDNTFKVLFLEPWLKLMNEDSKLFPSYNQIVRTGRMSCSNPNAQQLNKRGKRLIKPDPGEAFLSLDASQMEFRIIIHYIQDIDAIKAYAEDPLTDFHQLVADSVTFEWEGETYHTNRKQGKTLNFAMSFGAGKKKVTAQLAGDDDLIKLISNAADNLILGGALSAEERENYTVNKCFEIAEKVYASYHDKFPGMKKISKAAEDSTKEKGYAVNLLGRRRYLSFKRAWIAFNTAVQGSASDIIKWLMINLAPKNNKFMRDRGLRMVAAVHDEIVIAGPISEIRNMDNIAYIVKFLSRSPVPLRTPLVWDAGISENNWAEAAGDDTTFHSDGSFKSGKVPKELYAPELLTT